MSKTRDSVFSNLKVLLESSDIIDDDLFDELEEIFIMADIGVNTVVKFVDHLRDTVDIKDISSPEDLKELIIDYIIFHLHKTKVNLEDGRIFKGHFTLKR